MKLADKLAKTAGKMSPRKLILLCAFFALMIFIILYSTLSSFEDKKEEKTPEAVGVAVIEAATDISPRTVITDDMLKASVVPESLLPPEKTIADAEKSMREHPDDTVAAEYLTPFSTGGVSFDVMANPKLLEEAYNLDTTLIRDLVVQLQLEYDYLIIDTTSTFSALNLSLMDLSTVIDFIGIVDFIPTIKNMKRGSDALKELGYDDNKIRYVLNRSNARTRINVKDVEAILGHQFHYVIPNDFQTAAESIKTGVPLVLSAKDTPLAKGIRTMVDTYEEDTASPQKSQEGGWLSRLFS